MDLKQLDAIERWNWIIAIVLVLAAALLFDTSVLLGVAVGAFLCCANFWGIHKLIVKSMRVEGRQRAALQLLLVAKMVLLMFVIFLVMKYLPLSPAALAVGLSVFFLSIAVESARFALGGKVNGDGRA